MTNEIQNNYIRIPNVVANNKNITIGAKYLYGYIWYWTYWGDFIKTNDEVCDALDVSLNTLRKYIRELEREGFISIHIEKHNTERHIRLLVTDEFILRESARVRGKKAQEEQIKNPTVDIPQCAKDFMNQIV